MAGLQSTVIALPYADYKAEELDPLLSVPTHTWTVANKDRWSEYSACIPNREGQGLGKNHGRSRIIIDSENIDLQPFCQYSPS